MHEFSSRDLKLLREAVRANAPELLHLLDLPADVPLSERERESLRNALATELCNSGLNADDEPNERGLALERLIDMLAKK